MQLAANNRGRYYSSRLESERPSPIRGNSGKYSARPSDVKTVQGHGARNDHPWDDFACNCSRSRCI